MPVRPYEQNQLFLLPPSLDEWISKDHPARVFSDIIDRLDTYGFQEIKPEGRPRYDTKMMLKTLLWGYATGIRSSRKIEEKLHSDVVFMWLAGLEKPDFRTICLFRRANVERLNYIFSEVILLAKSLGLVRLGLVALDGTKVQASASAGSFRELKRWREELKKAREEVKQILSEAEEADLADNAKYGECRRGDEIPEGLKEGKDRLKKIEDLIKEAEQLKRGDDARVSSTDAEAIFMRDKQRLIPAYNCEAAVTEGQVIVYSDVTTEPVDANQLTPALDSIEDVCGEKPSHVAADAGFNSGKNLHELEERKINGYIPDCQEDNIGEKMVNDVGVYGKEQFLYEKERDCYICPAGEVLTVKNHTYRRSKYSESRVTIYGAEPEKCSGCAHKQRCTRSKSRRIMRTEFEEERLRMREKLKTEEGRAIYKKRKWIVEPVFGQIKEVGRFVRFLLRGLIGARVEWKWVTIAHNLLKVARKAISGEVKLSSIAAANVCGF